MKKDFIYSLRFVLIILAFGQAAFADELKWREISEKELETTVSVVEPNSDAEAIFREVRLSSKTPYEITAKTYVRIKIYTQLGIKLNKILEFPIADILKNFGARVISPNGSITEIKESDFFEKELITTKYVSKKVKAAPIPNLETGSILEYQYQENIRTDYTANENPYYLDFQWIMPVQKMIYIVELDGETEKWVTIPVNMQNITLRAESKNSNFYIVSAQNLFPFQTESFMPPPSVIRKRLIIKKNKSKIDRNLPDLWSAFAGNHIDRLRKIKKISKEKDVLRKALEITANAETDEDKIKFLFEIIRKEIKNWQADPNFTEEDRKNLPMNDPPMKLFKTKIGHGAEIDDLFAGLVKSIGFDVRLGVSSDRREYLYDGSNYNLLQNMRVVGFYIKMGGEWRFFSPSNPFMKFGENYWYFTGNTQMLINEKDWISYIAPPITPQENKIRRTAIFTIDENGHLEGKVKLSFTGYQAFDKRLENKDFDIETVKNNLLLQLKKSFSEVEIKNFEIKNDGDFTTPYLVSFDIYVFRYAQKVGNRILFQPALFQFNSNSLFPYSKRVHPIYFSNPWSEEDEITYFFPKDYISEELPFSNIKDRNHIAELNILTSIDAKSNSLKYKRNFTFGNNNRISFSKEEYGEIKNLFDAFNKADSSLISFRKK